MKPKWLGRLAMRDEGEWIVGYYVLPNTMEDAIELGRLRRSMVTDAGGSDGPMFGAFTDLLWEWVADILEEQTGERPGRETRPAPTHERTQ